MPSVTLLVLATVYIVSGVPSHAHDTHRTHSRHGSPHDPTTPTTSHTSPQNTTTLRFFTDSRLDLRANTQRVVATPRLVSMYHDLPNVDLTFAVPGVVKDPIKGGWRLVYQHYGGPNAPVVGPLCCLVAYAEDGINWVPENTTTTLPDLPNRQFPNQVMPNPGQLNSVFTDPTPNAVAAKCTYKALISHNQQPLASQVAPVWCSMDGLHWSAGQDMVWMLPGRDVPEGPAFAFWNPVSGRIGLSTRPMWGDRRVTYHETIDWTINTTTAPQLVFEPDDVDTEVADHYGMMVIPLDTSTNGGGVEDVPSSTDFVGLLWVYHTPPGQGDRYGAPGVIGGCPQKYNGGRIDVQLTFSRNGQYWQRTSRTPFLPNTFGAQTGGLVTPSGIHTLSNGTMLLVASSSRREHGNLATAFPQDSAVLTYAIDPDRWVGLESMGGTGYIGTRVLFLRSTAPLSVNIDCRYGSARAQLTDHNGIPLPGYTFDDSQSVSDDLYAWVPAWGNTTTTTTTEASHKNINHANAVRTAGGSNTSVIRLEIELNNARVYAISGDFLPMQDVEVFDWLQHGNAPLPRPGF